MSDVKYRPEIDGLRAVAVIPVILFHAGIKVFSGGYLGVDIFFVISGFLITTILYSELENGKFSIVKFYERRARRILPALFFLIILCIPAAFIYLEPAPFAAFSKSMLAVLFFVSNIFFWHKSDYFSPDVDLYPLLHTWSLAVEEQYYVVFPLLLSALRKYERKFTFWVVVTIAVASFAASEWGWRHWPIANFYLAHTRAWELLAGSAAALWQNQRARLENNMLANVGLCLIVIALLFFDKNVPVPSIFTLVPVQGTVLVLLFSGVGNTAGRLLSTRPMVSVGLVSYSAYLWHQPVFAFARIRSGGLPPEVLMYGLALASLAAAVFTWRYVEQPFRDRRTVETRRFAIIALAVALTLLMLGVIGIATHGVETRYTKAEQATLAFQAYPALPYYREGACFLRDNQEASELSDICLKGKAMLWGDSHAAAFSFGLRSIYPDATAQLTMSACPPLWIKAPDLPLGCAGFNNRALREIGKSKPRRLYIHANWAAHIDQLDALAGTLRAIKRVSPTSAITVIGGVPAWQPGLPSAMVRAGVDTSRPLVYLPSPKTVGVKKADKKVAQIARNEGARFLSPLSVLCNARGCLATVEFQNHVEVTAWDIGHMTAGGSLYVAAHLFAGKKSAATLGKIGEIGAHDQGIRR